jgi:hypothetical protein
MTAPDGRHRLGGAVGFVCFAIVAVALAAYLHLSLPNTPDRDGLYHYRHASLYWEHGPLTHGLPWSSYSVLSSIGADIWYGFHLLLAPFTLGRDPVRGVKLAGVFDLAALLVLVYAAMRFARMRLAFLWPLVVIGFSPYLLYRFVMTRPHVISTGFAALLLACAVDGSLWGIGLVSFAITFVHLGFFWVIPLIVGVVIFTKRVTEGKLDWREIAAAIAGGMVGWALRPDPIGAAKMVYIQIVELAILKQQGVPLLFGADLVSGMQSLQQYGGNFLWHFLPALALWAMAAIILVAAATSQAELTPRARTLLWSSFALSAVTVVIMMRFSLRAIDLISVFTVMLAAAVHTHILGPGIAGRSGFSTPASLRAVTAIGGVLIAFMLFRGGYEHARVMPKLGYSPTRFKLAAEWLADNSEPGDIAFNAHWDLFPDLFFWNTKDRYVGGQDPIFQYAYSPSLYWKAHHLYTGQFSSYTCGEPVCGPSNGEDTFTVLQRDFNAKFLVMEQKRQPALFQYAVNDPRFQFVFDDGEVAVFRLGGRPQRQ